MNLKDHIANIPDFPKPGILFYDISTLLAHPEAWAYCIKSMTELVSDFKPDMLAGIESRGFLSAGPLALALGIGFTMVRKPGKLPGEIIEHAYDLEYGSDRLQIKSDIITRGQRIVIVDDLLATGGTLAATVSLCRQAGANVVGAVCIVELDDLMGRDKVDIPVKSLLHY